MGDSERNVALGWASEARTVRHRLREQLQAGELTLSEVLSSAQTDPLIGQVKLLWTLESLIGARKVLTRRKLAELGIAEATRIGALSYRQRELIESNFGGAV